MAKEKAEKAKIETVDDLLLAMDGIDGGDSNFDVSSAPTGITSFDASTGIGGFPRKRVTIIQGEEHSGKTLLLLTAIAYSQRNGGRCAFIDAEHALTPQFARLLGVDWDALKPFVRRPRTMNQAYDLLKEMGRTGMFDIIGFDSVTALTTDDAIEASAGAAQSRAAVPRMHSEELPKLIASLHERTAVVFINQMRENPNPPTWHKGGKLLYTPGGKALRHASSLTVEVKPGQVYKKGEARIGHQLKTNILKNKVGIPYKRAEFDLMYAEGLDLTTDTIDTAIEVGIIRQSGSWFYFDMVDPDTSEVLEEMKFAGRDKIEERFRTDEGFALLIQNAVEAATQVEE